MQPVKGLTQTTSTSSQPSNESIHSQDLLNQHTHSQQLTAQNLNKWSYQDFVWCLSLFGTAVGAGVLFLPIKAGIGGFWPLVILAILTVPMIWFSHKSLARFVLSASKPNADITDAVEEHFGKTGANLITFAYFFAIYPIVLIYGVAITNTVDSFMVNQLGMMQLPRWLLSGLLILAMTACLMFGKDIMLKATSFMVYPLVLILFGLSLFLIPEWNGAMLSAKPDWAGMPSVIWLAIPIIVFSFNHSPIISQFSKTQRELYGENAVIKTDKITGGTAWMLMGFVMLFVFSVVLSLSPEQLAQAKEQNISVLSYLANIHASPFISYLGPIIAFAAIASSYFGHFLGAQEGLVGLVKSRSTMSEQKISTYSMIFIVLTTWIVAMIDPSILGMIETLGAPMIAAILFIMPIYAMRKIPAMQRFKTHPVSQVFTLICGLLAISAVIYSAVLPN